MLISADDFMPSSEYEVITDQTRQSACRERREGRGCKYFQARPKGRVRYKRSDVAKYMREHTHKPLAGV